MQKDSLILIYKIHICIRTSTTLLACTMLLHHSSWYLYKYKQYLTCTVLVLLAGICFIFGFGFVTNRTERTRLNVGEDPVFRKFRKKKNILFETKNLHKQYQRSLVFPLCLNRYIMTVPIEKRSRPTFFKKVIFDLKKDYNVEMTDLHLKLRRRKIRCWISCIPVVTADDE